jgi:putative transposase
MQPKGWHSRGYLPHFDSPETVQFVTFRLADSLPAHLTKVLRDHEHAFPRLDRELDASLGACWLGRSDIASMVEEALLHFDGRRYRLLAWCLMPNHAHVVVEIVAENSLSEIIGSWKSFTAKQANNIIRRSGAFWHADYFDRYMRDEDHLARTIDYVENNPVKAGLVTASAEWPWSSARFSKT